MFQPLRNHRITQHDSATIGVALPQLFTEFLERQEAAYKIVGDTELTRLSIGLKQSSEIRIWLLIEQHARETNLNHLSRLQLETLLERYGIKYSQQNLDKWLRRGHSLYWRLDEKGSLIWLIGYKRLSEILTNRALRFGLIDLIITNNPGQRKSMYIDMRSDTVEQFEANCYAGWHASKTNNQIARFTLTRLFNRSTKTLIKWEKLAGITIIHGITHYSAEHADAVPLNTKGEGLRGDVLEYEVNGKTRWSAEYSNIYQTLPMKQHAVRGQSRKVARHLHKLLKSFESAGLIGQGGNPGGLNPTGRVIFDDDKRAKAHAKRYGEKPRQLRKGFDNRRCAHSEYAPDGIGRMRARECYRASIALETN